MPNKKIFLALLLVIVPLVVLITSYITTPPIVFAAQSRVGLGTADDFAVLAGAGITNTGATTISGDVGTFPTTSETGFAGLVTFSSGANHAGDAVTQGAKNDLVTAYNDAAGRTGPTLIAGGELGGSTLTPASIKMTVHRPRLQSQALSRSTVKETPMLFLSSNLPQPSMRQTPARLFLKMALRPAMFIGK